ncbi:MAG: hypothetical protein AAGD06_09420 [Acidobacteriota bacterium]
MIRRRAFGKLPFVPVCFLALMLIAGASVADEGPGGAAADAVHPAAAIAGNSAALVETAAQPTCAPLMLAEAETDNQWFANQRAKMEFLEERNLSIGVKVCATPISSNAANAIATAATCGDCPTCLSAGNCNGCAVGAVCSPPGTVPVRAFRSVATCTKWFRTVHCCGCS